MENIKEMKRLFPLVFLVIQCQTEPRPEPYSESFSSYAHEQGFALKGDSVLTQGGQNFTKRISTGLERTKNYTFKKKEGTEIIVTRLNYTDLSIEYTKNGKTTIMSASMGIDMLDKKYFIQSDPDNIPANVFFIELEDCTLSLMLSRIKEWDISVADSLKVLIIADPHECLPENLSSFDGNYYSDM